MYHQVEEAEGEEEEEVESSDSGESDYGLDGKTPEELNKRS